MTRPILNLDEVQFETQKDGEAFEAMFGPIASRLSAKKLGYRITILPPGKKAWPFHAHYANEEMFFILEGRGRLRYGDCEFPIRAGDFIAAPAGGIESAHQIVNDSEVDLKYLCVSTKEGLDVMEYPDSNKFGVLAAAPPDGAKEKRTFAFFGYKSATVGYWEGEEK